MKALWNIEAARRMNGVDPMELRQRMLEFDDTDDSSMSDAEIMAALERMSDDDRWTALQLLPDDDVRRLFNRMNND